MRPGDIIAEIETDKATMEVEAVDEGVIGQILVRPAPRRCRSTRRLRSCSARARGPVPLRRQHLGRRPPRPAPAPLQRRAGGRRNRAALAPRHPVPRCQCAACGAERMAMPAGRACLPRPLARRLAKAAGIDIAALQRLGPARADRRAGRRRRAEVRWRCAGGRVAPHRRSATSAAQQWRHVASPSPAKVAVRRRSCAMPDDKILALYDKSAYEVVPHDGMRRDHRAAADAIEADRAALLHVG